MGTMYLAASSTHLAAAAAKSSGSSMYTFVIIAVLIGLFYVLIMRPQRNRQRKVQQAQNQVMPGQRIRTTAGMYGTVVSGDDRDIVIEIAPGVNVTMLRRAVMEVLPEDEPMPDPMAQAEEPDTGEDGPDQAAPDDWDIKDSNL